MAGALDIPAAVPPQFRTLVRARLHMPKPQQGFESRFEIEAGHGYELSVIGQGDVVAVEVTRPTRSKSPLERLLGLDQAVTDYVARGTVTQRRIAASFGKFGSVDVRFRPSGRVLRSEPRRRCRGGDRFTNRLGVFVGAVRFSGEKHYVAVRAHRARGRIRSPLHLHCALPPIRPPAQSRARPLSPHPIFTPATLTAGWRHAVAATELFVLRARTATLFLALSEESTGSIAELRYGLATAPSKVFDFNDALTAATIAPPAPFHGKGVYAAAPDGTTSWTGPLSVSFPGAPRTPLTGPQFEVELSAGY
ncbi:MAG: hypothetical protein QOF85_1515 [Solirubrobacterales bacterium]|nr:hypothetical protein [Solirubrobacterales bacterium]